VAHSVGNKIMGQAKAKLENKWRREMGLPKWNRGMDKQSASALSKYFLKGFPA